MMNSGSVGEKRCPQRLPAGESGEVTRGPLRDKSFALIDLLKKHRVEKELDAQTKERKQRMESLQQRKNELHAEMKKARELHLSYTFPKHDNADQAAEKAQGERREVLQLDAEMERLNVECAEVRGRKQELQLQVQRHSLYPDFMEHVVKMTKFDYVQELMGHVENLHHFRHHLYQKESNALEQVDQQKKALRTLEDQHHLLCLHKKSQLSQLQTDLEKTLSEALTWDKKWNHIRETAAKKTLLLGQIKMVILNLYEMTDDHVEGEEAVDMNDMEKQLDEIAMFIQDHEDIVKHHISSQRHGGQEKDKPKKHIATHLDKNITI